MIDPFDPNGEQRRETQMLINFDFLLKHIDAVHTALCSHQKHWQYRTWQQRAEEATKEAQARAKCREDYCLLDRACFERGCMAAQYPAPSDAVKCVIEEVK